MVNITKFLIVNQTMFEGIILQFNLTLDVTDPVYLLTFLFANFLAYMCIFTVLYVVKFMFFELFRKRKDGVLF